MKILITGGTGFIGSHLVKYLSKESHHIVLLTRSISRTSTLNNATMKYIHWDPQMIGEWTDELNDCDMVINLIGKNVFEERWNEKVKQEILNSRIIPTKLLVEAIGRAKHKPSLLISASAVGFYGDRNDEIITEVSSGGNDFLADVVKQWEGAAYEAEKFGVRVATPRIGLVLEKSGGMIGKMLLPFKLFVGGPIGSGKQFLPWVHMDDVVRGILYPIGNKNFRGIYNLVSPNPISMNDFSAIFGKIIHRPSWIPAPNFALQILYGEGAKVILSGQKAIPEKLLAAGYQFSYPELKTAMNNILKT
ncbi:MAG TPA: TIGR01777 family protein [Bacteroidetes bacterium]|nr:TIGR01777 family protein [Bacteroidota bacterium]